LRKELGIVDALKGIELVSCRAKAVYADFILAGPLNLWFKKLVTNPEPKYIIINKENGENSRMLYASILKFSTGEMSGRM